MPLNRLQLLIEASIADPSREPDFLNGLLDAPLFVHLPLSDDSSRVRLVQFSRPDGLSVIPVFTDLDRAQRAAQGHVRVATVPGRDLLEATRGATLMLDPNDTNCTLYPEEIAALLDEGMAFSAPIKVPPASPELVPAEENFRWIGDLAASAVEPIDQVQTIWLARRIDMPLDAPPTLVVILGVEPAYAERAIRAMGLAFAAGLRGKDVTVDATAVEPSVSIEPWPTAMGIDPHWTRRSRTAKH